MRIIKSLVCLIVICVLAEEVFPRQRTLSLDEKAQLKEAQTIYVETIALTEKGLVKPDGIREVVDRRLEEMGYSVTHSSQDPRDVTVKIKCEERKTWAGVTTRGGDADRLFSHSRVWKGPACQVTYSLNEQVSGWRQEVRTNFENAIRAAKIAQVKDSGAYALTELTRQLEEDDFPLLLTAEWRQAERLMKLMNQPETDNHLRAKIIPLLGKTSDQSVLAPLTEALHDPALAPDAAIALGNLGEPAAETLLQLLESTQSPPLKVATVKGLGEIVTHSPNPTIMDALLTTLQKPNIELPVQTEIVKALGKLSNQRAVAPLEELNRKAWTNSSNDPGMKELREALSWSLWQLNPDPHSAE